jgi:hypothetical protein
METVIIGSMPSSMTTTGTSRSTSNRYQEASKNDEEQSLAPPDRNYPVRNSKVLVKGTEEDAYEKKSEIDYRSRQNHRDSDNIAINNRNEEEDSSEDEEVVPGAFAVGDREERRHKGRLTAITMNMAGGVDMYMGEESSATGAPSELQAEPDDTTDPNERTFWFTKREKLLALGCFFLVVLPLGLGFVFGLALNKDDGGKSKSPTSVPFTLQDELRVKLAEFSMDGDSVFDDPISPQNLAIEWLAGDTVWQIQNSTLHMERRYGLAVLYYSTQGDTWQETYDFLMDSDECTWNNGDEEQDRINWKGVICNEEDQVAEILLGMYLLFI